MAEIAPDVRFVWPRGLYEHALLDREAAKEWILDSGFAVREDWRGEVRLLLDGAPFRESTVNGSAIASRHWSVEVVFWCDSEEAIRELMAAEFPMGVSRTKRPKGGE